MKLAYINLEGGVSIDDEDAEDRLIDQGIPYEKLDTIPDREHRDAWILNNGVITIDPIKKDRKRIIGKALQLINAVFPAIKSIDQVMLLAEQWLSIAPAARKPTTNYKKLIDIYVVAKQAIDNKTPYGDVTWP
ncbi:MAG: hypothetical protein V3T88_02790 [Nitrosomonadaceae bacterium]